ncbi:MAG: indolepyruvate oxidoreductase subunit beta [Halanaerobiaceae bacterium]|nr:indolepyruvate oxidoreductase subunit beta [Halanaerobiaceae bacterium]
MNKANILLAGVGGQGIILASRIIGNTALMNSYDVKLSEVHGMAQRGGSVISSVKMGEKVYSPIIEKQEADIILAFEKLEALRWIEYLKPGGRMIINDQEIMPVSVTTGKDSYPEDIISRIKAHYDNTVCIDALKIARECGNIKVLNTVLIGLTASFMELGKEDRLKSIRELVPERFVEINIKAFERGYNYAKS